MWIIPFLARCDSRLRLHHQDHHQTETKNNIKKSKNKRWYILYLFTFLCCVAWLQQHWDQIIPLKDFGLYLNVFLSDSPCSSDLDHLRPPPPLPLTSPCIWCWVEWGSPWRKAGWDFCWAGKVQTWNERALENIDESLNWMSSYQSPSLHLLMNDSILAIFEDFLKYLFILMFIRWYRRRDDLETGCKD